jgi:hypothetical protein
MAAKRQYPDAYGKQTSALPDILGPLNIDQEGDSLVPVNVMNEVADGWCHGKESKDPLGVVVKGGK